MTPTRGLEGELIALLVSGTIAAVLGAYGVRVRRLGRIKSARLDSQRGTLFLGRYPIEAFHWVARVIGVALAKRRISPDALTLTSLVLTAFTAPLAATGHFEAAGGVLLLGSAFDALDGIVARERGAASEAGEVLDSVLDRYADAFPLVGMALFYRQSAARLAIVLAALLGSMMVSYVRAKGEKFALAQPSTVMRRPERIAYLSLSLLLGPLVSSWIAPADPTRPITLAVVALVGAVANGAAVRLLTGARAELANRRARAPAVLAMARKALQAESPWTRLEHGRARNDVLVRRADAALVLLPFRIVGDAARHEVGLFAALRGERPDLRSARPGASRAPVRRAPAVSGRRMPRRRRKGDFLK